MTFETYSPDMMNALSLRLFDICAELRKMATDSQKTGLDTIPLHDKKAMEWIANLELWAQKSRANLDVVLSQRKVG